jgi:hypothetical protein
MKIIIDLETIPLAGAEAWLDPLPPLEPVTADKRLTDPVKIAASLTERAAAQATERALEEAKRIAAMALDPDCCRIVALGTQKYLGPYDVELMADEFEERGILEQFWATVREYGPDLQLITFNGLGFDLPVLMRRSMWHGLKCPQLSTDRYRSPHPDLYQRLTHQGAVKAHPLRFYRRRLGLPDDPHTGANIAALVAAGDWAAVEAHCRCDLETTHKLAKTMGVW